MKITEKDIYRTAQLLRDEENEQLHVRPWRRNRRFHIPTWLVAVPAAAVLGFILGIWTRTPIQSDAPLTALVDTVYIKVHDSTVVPDTATTITSQKISDKKRTKYKTAGRQQPSHQGKSIADDHIRYDLLVKN